LIWLESEGALSLMIFQYFFYFYNTQHFAKMRSNFAVNSHYYFFHQTSKKIQKDSDPNGKLTIHVYPIKFRIIFIQPLPTPPHAARSAAHQPTIRCESIMQAVHSPKPNGRLKVSRGI